MPTAVKVSEKLLTMARQEAAGSHRSITAQIEHWATIGRAVEVMLAYRDVLALKRTGSAYMSWRTICAATRPCIAIGHCAHPMRPKATERRP